MQEGKLLGKIFSKQGVSIDLERVEDMQTISLPKHKQEVQFF